MKITFLNLFIVSASLALSSCTRYIVSPLNTTSNPYTPIPVKQRDEPSKSATYVGLGISPGGVFVDEDYNDFFNYGSLRIAQGHAFSALRASYSGNLMLGAAHLSRNGNLDPEGIYRQANGGNLFSGAFGVNGTLSFAVPFKSGHGEWRVLGVQGSGFNEFGKFQTFRKNFPDSTGGYIDRKSTYWSAGVFTEFVRLARNDKFFGFKFALSLSSFPDPWNEDDNSFEGLPSIPRYFSFTPFFGKGYGSGFLQVNFGTGASSLQMGFLLDLKAFTKKEDR